MGNTVFGDERKSKEAGKRRLMAARGSFLLQWLRAAQAPKEKMAIEQQKNGAIV